MNDTTMGSRPCAANGILRLRGAIMGMGAVAALGLGQLGAHGAGEIPGLECFTVQFPEALRLQGDPALGTEGLLQNFDRPAASTFGGPAGWWAFTGDIDGPTAIDDVLYAGDRLVVREGDPIPGTDVLVESIPSFDGGRPMNIEGQVAAVIEVGAVDGRSMEAVIREQEIVALAGDLVPDGEGDRYTMFSFVSLLDDGRVGFMARTDGPANRDSVLVLDGVVLHRKGAPVPWEPEITWDGIFDEVTWNGRGDLLFEGNTSAAIDQDRVLVLEQQTLEGGRTWTILAREGDVFDSEKGPVALELVQQAALSEQGEWAARITLRDVPPGIADAILGADGLVLREGDPVAAIDGVNVSHITAVAVDGFGRIGAVSELTGELPGGVTHAVFIDGCAAASTGVGAIGLPGDAWLAWVGFEDLAGIDTGGFVFTAGYGGSIAGDGLFVVGGDAPCPADVDGDGSVGGLDVLAVLSGWGPCPGFICGGDLDLDGVIDLEDLLRMLASWGACSG